MTEPTTTEPTTAAQGEPAATTGGKTDPGPAGGDKAILAELKQERVARQELEKQIKALQERDPVKAIAEALGVKPAGTGTDAVAALTDQVKQLQESQRKAELEAARLTVAAAKGLTPAQAARLQGSTRDELEADADQLKALFPSAPANGTTPGTPAPDPSQGARGGTGDLEARLAQAVKDGRTGDAIHLKTQLAEQRSKNP